MKINMNDSRITNISQLRDFLKGTQKFDLSLRNGSIEEKYCFIDKTIDRLKYNKFSKKDKRIVVYYLKKFTGYKGGNLYRLISRAKKGELSRKTYQRKNPNKKYKKEDIKLLEITDAFHLRLNSLATKEILRREYELFGKKEYANISNVSPSHINNLRKSPIYKSLWINHTKARQVPIGVTVPPEAHGRPGSIRVDTVHQRDVYHVNSVDEITQWEAVVCVPQISESCLYPALFDILGQYPFVIFNFHSDRGSEYINYVVSKLLNKLMIKQTKTRSRHPNDNALVETKNGSIIRKNMGWEHVDQSMADAINNYYTNYFNPYLNFHRPCVFSNKSITYPNGRVRKIYNQATTPYEKLKEVSAAKNKNFLKRGVTFDACDKIAYKYSDNEFAKILRKEELKLFNIIRKQHNGSRREDEKGN
jgi:hypothetical protein